MLQFLSTLLSGFLSLLGGLLPESPFAGWATVTSDLALGLGWLNWLVDVDGCLAIFALWVSLGVAACLAKIVYRQTRRRFEAFSANWNGGYTK